MTVETTPETEETFCARHPKVETALRCGRCDTPICPKCMVPTDVGARCPECAPRRKLPQFEVGPLFAIRAAVASAVCGAALGAAWGFFFGTGIGFLAIFLGIGLGYAVAEPVSIATKRKAGPIMQSIAVAGVVLAYVVRNLVAGEAPILEDDFWGYLLAAIGAVVAINRLRD